MSTEIASQSIVACQAKDDADTLIVKTTMDLVTSVNTPVIVAQDTDILFCNCSNLYLQSNPGGPYDISTIAIVDQEEFLSMDGLEMTVSCIHGHTKCALYKCKFPASVITAFTSITSTEATIQTVGLKAM